MLRPLGRSTLLFCSALLALWSAHAWAAPLPSFFEGMESPALTAALAFSGTAIDWDDTPAPLAAPASQVDFNFLEPGAAGRGALSWEALNDAVSVDFAALPDPDSQPDRLTKFIVILLVLGVVFRYFTSKAWTEFLSDVYYPRNY
jgi:hypothetical protein